MDEWHFVLFTEDVYFIYASLCINCIIKTINNALYLSDAGDGDTQTMCKLYTWSDYCHTPDQYCKYFIEMGRVYEIQCNVMQVRQYNNVWQSQNKNVTLVMRSCQSCHFLVIRGWIFFIHGRMFKILTYFILYWLSKHIELKDITQKKMYFYFNNLICKLFFNLVLAILPQ